MANDQIDIGSIMRDTLWYYIDGHDESHLGMGVFRRPFEHLKDHLRENYLREYRERKIKEDKDNALILPRTRYFISCAKSVIFGRLLDGEGFDFEVEGTGEFKDLNFYKAIEEREDYELAMRMPFSVDSSKIIVKDPRGLIDRCNQAFKKSELIRCGVNELVEVGV